MYTRYAEPSADCVFQILQHDTSKSEETIRGHSTGDHISSECYASR
jgi:hypothetical protein